MNRYVCFYKKKTVEIEAPSSYVAQSLAATKFKAKKAWDVAVVLIEVDGNPLVTTLD